MKTHRTSTILLPRLAACALVLAGLALSWQLLVLRHRSGTSHPPYSSHRADPLGARVLHEALGSLRDTHVVRLEDTAAGLDTPTATTLLVLGLDAPETGALPESLARSIEAFAHAGGRVVVALTPQPRETWATRRAERRARTGPGSPGTEEALDPPASLRERWGFDLAYDWLPLAADGSGSIHPASATASPLGAAASLPTELAWRTGVRLSLVSTNWQALYLVGDQPVLAQRRWGAGELCVTTDAYPFSNEGMVKDRHPGLLAWFLGERRIVVFEETHLGTERSGGVAVLARHYRLHGFLVGALLVLGLAVLRAQWPLVPRARAGKTEDAVPGLASDAGLASLVQRAIPSEELPRLALEEWTRSVGSHHPGWTPLLGQLAQQVQQDAARGSHQRDAVGTLAAMTEVVRSSRATRQATAASPLDLPRP